MLNSHSSPASLAKQSMGLARQLRADVIRCTTQVGSTHGPSCLSAADIMAVFALSHWRYDFAFPHRPDNDRLILCKGYAAPLLYAVLRAGGVISDGELVNMDSLLEGYPSPRLPYVDVDVGSSGQGLSIAVGAALAGKQREGHDFTVWVLLGGGEMAEGFCYEAMEAAAHYQLDNLVVMIDVNRESDPEWDIDHYRRRVEAFGWEAICIDGHDHAAIEGALAATRAIGHPTCIIASTVKSKRVSTLENSDDWHDSDSAPRMTIVPKCPPGPVPAQPVHTVKGVHPPSYGLGTMVSCQQAYNETVRALSEVRDDVVVLDSEDSTRSIISPEAHAARLFAMFVAEQLMISVGRGLTFPGSKAVFCSIRAAFVVRAHEQIRTAAIAGACLRLCGSHAGLLAGEAGRLPMGLEDIAALRTIPGSTVLSPCDAVSTAALVGLMAEVQGISYLRIAHVTMPVIYSDGEVFRLGGAKFLRRSDADVATVIATGITVHEALIAHAELARRGISVRIIDLYSIKPIDLELVCSAARETGHVVVCEDHHPEGGVGEAVLAAFATGRVAPDFTHLAVQGVPCPGRPAELMKRFGITADHIVMAVVGKALGGDVPST